MAGRESRLVTELHVPVGKREVSYILSERRDGNYRDVGRSILKMGRFVPIGDDTAPLFRDLYLGVNKDKELVTEARGFLDNSGILWVYNCNLFVGEHKSLGPKGVYVVPDRKALGFGMKLDRKTLERKLKGVKEVNGVRTNGEVRFAVEGSYSLGEMDPDKLAKDGFRRISLLDIGAKLLAEVASSLRHGIKSYDADVKDEERPIQCVSALVRRGGRLQVGSERWAGYWGGNSFAFPVSAYSLAQKN